MTPVMRGRVRVQRRLIGRYLKPVSTFRGRDSQRRIGTSLRLYPCRQNRGMDDLAGMQ